MRLIRYNTRPSDIDLTTLNDRFSTSISINRENGLEPNEFLDESTIILAPLDQCPFFPSESPFCITALLKRQGGRIKIYAEEFENGQPFWLPLQASVYCPEDLVWQQLQQSRTDLQKVKAKKSAQVMVNTAPDSPSDWKVKSIHPAELTPAAGSGVLAFVCARDNKYWRQQLLEYHDETTAILSNVERSMLLKADETYDHLAAHCELDKHGRYHFNVCAIQEGQITRHRQLQSSWVGLAGSALNYLKQNVSL